MDTNSLKAQEAPSFSDLLAQIEQEHEQTQKELKEIEVLIRQSSAEVEKLAQRNAQLATKLRQMEANLDTVPRHDIKEIYTAAQEAQMRLFMMRGQVEQLQARQQHLERHANVLRQVLDMAGQAGLGVDGAKPGQVSAEGEGSLIVRIINAQENERQRLARQMHDGPAQSLTNLILQAEICERLFDTDPVRARTELSNLKDAVTSTFQKVREFIFDLRPMMLDDLGLNPTLKRYVQDFESKSGLACNLVISGKDQRLPPHAEVTVFRVVQSLLNNVREHANATHVEISLDLGPEGLRAKIEDDGGGFDVAEVLAAARQRKTMGLASVIEQVEMLGGQIQFDSSLGRGTKVEFSLPV
ncbi:MAG: sensor histidine kinase [Anaerolineae bacterium]